MSRPHPGWSEQDPADWIRATEEAVGELKALASGKELAAVKGIGLSGQMHGATLLDADGQGAAALHPVERHAQPRRGGGSSTPIRASGTITGNIVFPGFTAPKLLWVKNNEPEIFAQGRARCCCRRTICGSG